MVVRGGIEMHRPSISGGGVAMPLAFTFSNHRANATGRKTVRTSFVDNIDITSASSLRQNSFLSTQTAFTKESPIRTELLCNKHDCHTHHINTSCEDDVSVSHPKRSKSPVKNGIQTFWNRTHGLMDRAGLHNSLQQGNPLKNPIVLVLLVFAGKYIRAKFIMKGQSKMNEFQPAWGHVITSKEQEKKLHAYMCKNCGTTIFIAKGREFRFFNQFAQCLNCGKVGRNNFKDIRDDVVEEADDGEFVYESPVNYRLSKRERKQLEEEQAKEAEELKQLEEEEEEAEKLEPPKKKKKKKKKKKVDVVDAEIVEENTSTTTTTEKENKEETSTTSDEKVKGGEEKEEKVVKQPAPSPVVMKTSEEEKEVLPLNDETDTDATKSSSPAPAPVAVNKPKPKAKPKPKTSSSSSLGDLDILDMD